MICAAGIDLGGTKSEVQLFDQQWRQRDVRRDPTPRTYPELVELLATQVHWALERAQGSVPIGLGAAGLLYPDGTSFTANLPVKGQTLLDDLIRSAGHSVTYVNDCRAMALSEAIYGAGRGYTTVMALILGTGVGGGIVQHGRLLPAGPSGTGGEFGHMPASALVAQSNGLPSRPCGCGRLGCAETYIAGPGMSALALHLTGEQLTPEQIDARRHSDEAINEVWAVWVSFTADLLLSLVQVVDPDVIVLGGGLSQIPGVCEALSKGLAATQIRGFGIPRIVLAEGGDASGARGAAMAALAAGGSQDHA